MKLDLSGLTFNEEPVVYVALANAILVLAVSFGLPITPDQKMAIDGLITAVSAIFLRSQVFPSAHIEPEPAPEPKP